MSSKIKNHLSVIISIFILLQPVIDLITGMSVHVFHVNMTFGIIIKLLFLIFIMYTTLFVYHKKKVFSYYFIVFLYFILYILGLYLYKDGIGVFQEVQGLIKTFYFPLILISLYFIKDEFRISYNTLFITVMLYLTFIFIPTIFGSGYKTYEITKSGTLGFFNSANEISGIISILTPIIFITFSKNKHLLLKLLFVGIYLFTILNMGTKTPLLSLVITIVATMIYLWMKWIQAKKYKLFTFSVLGVLFGVIIFIMIVPSTNFYKNIKTHMDFLEVDHISEVFSDYQLVDHFIFSQRLTFLEKKNKVYTNSNIYQKLVGIGYLKNSKEMKLIEMDYFDIYYSHGILGFLLFFSGVGYVVVDIFKKKKKFSYEFYMIMVSFILIVLLSFMTGHIITGPSVSLMSAIIMLHLVWMNPKYVE